MYDEILNKENVEMKGAEFSDDVIVSGGIQTSEGLYTKNVVSEGKVSIPEANAYRIGGRNIIKTNLTSDSIIIGDSTGIPLGNTEVLGMGTDAGGRASGTRFVAMGYQAGWEAGDRFVALGRQSGLRAGDNFMGLGMRAGYESGSNFNSLGYYAGREAGDRFSAIGTIAGYGAGDRFTAIGYRSTSPAVGNGPDDINDSIAIGYQSAPQFDGHFVLQQANLNSDPLIEGDLNDGSVAFGSNTLSGLNDGDINVSTTNSDIIDLKTTTLGTCDSSTEGQIKYNGTAHYGCDGSSWNSLY